MRGAVLFAALVAAAVVFNEIDAAGGEREQARRRHVFSVHVVIRPPFELPVAPISCHWWPAPGGGPSWNGTSESFRPFALSTGSRAATGEEAES